jgi:hypothetical protein
MGAEDEPTRAPLVSREDELDRLQKFFAVDGQAAWLVLSGEPGIGKTTVWEAMRDFLVEVYLPRATAATAVPGPADISHVAEQLTREGRPARLLRSIFVPEDETCFYLFQAQSIDAVREAATRSRLRFERLVEVASDWAAPGGPTCSWRTRSKSGRQSSCDQFKVPVTSSNFL